MKNKTLLSALHILIVVLFGLVFIPSILSQPTSEDSFYRLHLTISAVVALVIGGFGALFPKKFNSGNIKSFQKMYALTGFRLFKLQAEKMANPYMVPFARAMGILFVLIGLVLLYKNLLG